MPNFKLTHNLLAITNAYPNSNTNFMQGIFIKNQIDSIRKNFLNVYVISPVLRDFGLMEKGRKCKNYSYDNVSVQYPKSIFVPQNYTRKIDIDFRLKHIKKIIDNLSSERNLLHAHFGIMGKTIVPLAKNSKLPFITSFYGYDIYQTIYDKEYYSTLFSVADFLIVLSDHMKNRLIELGSSKEKIKKIHIGIDTEKFKPLESPKIGSKEFLIVANFVEKKGILDGIKAFSLVVAENSETKLNILGRGPLKEKIISLIKKLQIEKNVNIIDNYATENPRKTVQDYMQKCDYFLLPSKRDSAGDCEGTPVVLMEASACGKPCITTNHSGNPEIIINEETGFVAPEGNVQKLAEYMLILLEDETLAKNFGRNGRFHIIEEFNENKQSEKLLQVYKAACDLKK